MKDLRNMYLIQLIQPVISGLNARSYSLDEELKIHRLALNFDYKKQKTTLK